MFQIVVQVLADFLQYDPATKAASAPRNIIHTIVAWDERSVRRTLSHSTYTGQTLLLRNHLKEHLVSTVCLQQIL